MIIILIIIIVIYIKIIIIIIINILPMDVVVEGIVTEFNNVGFPFISNMYRPITVRPEIRVTWEREEQ